MLRISWFEFLVRGIPEEFILVLAVHVFSKTAINVKKYLISGIIMCLMTYLVRMLPIQYGIHSLLGLVILIITVININKIDTIKSIRAGIITFILCFIFEGVNVIFLQFIFKEDMASLMNNNISKTLTGLPSIIFLGIIVITYYYILSKREELSHV